MEHLEGDEDDHLLFRTPMKSGSTNSMDSKHPGPHLIPSGLYLLEEVLRSSFENSSTMSSVDDS